MAGRQIMNVPKEKGTKKLIQIAIKVPDVRVTELSALNRLKAGTRTNPFRPLKAIP